MHEQSFAERLVGPVGRINIRELGDAGDLLDRQRAFRHRRIVGDTGNTDFSGAGRHRSEQPQEPAVPGQQEQPAVA